MTVLFDLNVVLDVVLGREAWRAEADAIWDANRDGRIDAWMSAAALPTLFYVVRKQADLRVPTWRSRTASGPWRSYPLTARPWKWRRTCPVPTSRTICISPAPWKPASTPSSPATPRTSPVPRSWS